MEVRDYRDLKVWQKAMDLAVEAYAAAKQFPDSERFGLVSQVQRAAASVPANIAEGHALGLPKLFLKHLRIANGSLAEAETHFRLAERLTLIESSLVDPIIEHAAEVRRMLFGLKKSLEKKIKPGN